MRRHRQSSLWLYGTLQVNWRKQNQSIFKHTKISEWIFGQIVGNLGVVVVVVDVVVDVVDVVAIARVAAVGRLIVDAPWNGQTSARGIPQ